MISPEDLIQDVLRCPNLPTIPGVSLEVLQMGQNPDIAASEVAEVVGRDPVLAGRILRTANSCLYAVRQEVSDLNRAVVVLGMRSVSALALGLSLGGAFRTSKSGDEELEVLWRRSLYSALAGRMLAAETKSSLPEEVFLSGLFQDIGVLGLRATLGESYSDVLAAAEDHEALCALEAQVLGTDHTMVGVAMAESWTLPARLISPIAFHHCPGQAPRGDQPMARLVWAARMTANVLMSTDTDAAAQRAKDVLGPEFGLDGEKIHKLLESLAKAAEELAEVFDVDLAPDRLDIALAQAQEALVGAALEADAEARRLRDANRELVETATKDALTGLHNRARLDEDMYELFDQSVQRRSPFGVIFVDADHFKQVNDTFGHAAGDEVLRRLADVIFSLGGECTYRYGGEEIVALLPDHDTQKTTKVAESVRAAVEEAAIEFEGKSIPVTVSIGVAATDPSCPAGTVDELITAADQAMYGAKKDGRNCVRIAEPIIADLY